MGAFKIRELCLGSSPTGPNVFQQAPQYGLSGWFEQNYDILPGLQEILLPFVKNVMILLSVLFIVLLIIYLVSTFGHRQQNLYLANRNNRWQSTLQSLLHGNLLPDDFALPHRDRRYFRDILVTVFPNQDISGRNRIKDLYHKLGFIHEDTRQLKSHLWWKRIQAIDRFTALDFGEVEKYVLPLIKDKRSEVRLGALQMLVSTGSAALPEMLSEIFTSNTRWSYRYIINKLYLTEIPVDALKPFAVSEDRDLRKGVATLLGKEGNNAAIPILQELVNDSVKDVRREAVSSLGRICSTAVIPVLTITVKDENPQVRAESARALGKLQDLSTLPIIEKLADDLEYSVRFQAFFALDRFGQPGENVIRKFQDKFPEIVREFLAKKNNGERSG